MLTFKVLNPVYLNILKYFTTEGVCILHWDILAPENP